MGQTLSEPITAKESSSLQNKSMKVGSSSMQGWRISMEDAHTHILTMADDKDASFFAVYDGHGGSKVATHVSRNLHRQILRRPEYKNGQYEEAITQGFLECDEKMRHEESLKDEMSGSTAITALLRGTDLYVGNVGDSRCIASINGVSEALSVDHKPGDMLERARIENAGGFVEFNRVNGNLALSRAVGDFAFKNNSSLPPEDQIVSTCPDIDNRTVTKDWEFILLACDGIWDVLSNQEVTDFVIRRIAKGLEPETICEELMTRCLATDCSMGGLGCDNMTVILVCFLHQQPYSKLVERCADLVKAKDESRAKFETENSSTDEIDDIDDVRGLNKLSGLNGVHNSNESNEINSPNTCQSNGVQESNGESMESDDSTTNKEISEDLHTNGLENTQNSPQIHPDKSENVKKDCADDVELDTSAS